MVVMIILMMVTAMDADLTIKMITIMMIKKR